MGNQKRYTTEKSLSDKGCTIVNLNNEDKSVYPEEDVKEFIKKCEELSVYAVHNSEGRGWGDKAIRIDDLKKLAGPKLTEKST